MELEYHSINAGIVTRTKRLRDLLEGEVPSCRARDDSAYRFDKQALHDFAGRLTEEEVMNLRLHITLSFSMGVPDHCYISDGVASEVLRRLENFGPAYRFKNGKMWMPASVGLDLLRRYGRIIQRLFLP